MHLKSSLLISSVLQLSRLVYGQYMPGNNTGAPLSGEVGAAFALTNAPTGNNVVAFSRDGSGRLSQVGVYETGGIGQGVDFDTQGGLQLSADNKFLYAVSPADDKVSVFAVNGSSLKLIQQIYAGDQPLAITLHADSQLAYVLDGSVATTGIFGFHVDENTGMLSPINNATIPTSTPIGVPGTVLFSPDGKSIVVTNKVGSVLDVYSVGESGLAEGPVTILASSGLRPFGAIFRPDGTLFIVESGLPVFTNAAISTYKLDNTGTSLHPITKSEKNQQTDGCWVVLGGSNQELAFTANFVSGTISSYSVGANGTVSIIDGTAASPGIDSNPVDLAVTADGALLYNLLRGPGSIIGWKINSQGGLDTIGTFGQGQALPANNGISGLAVY